MAPNDATDAADRDVVAALAAVRKALAEERRDRRRAVCRAVAAVVVAGLLATVIGSVISARVATSSATAVSREEGVRRARANCEAGNEGERRALERVQEALVGLTDGDPAEEARLSPRERARAQAARERARAIGAEKLRPEPRNCAAEFPLPR